MGYEIRLVANSQLELVQLQWTIRAAGLKPGNPYTKANRWVVPIYGRDTMERFVAWIEKFGKNGSAKRERRQKAEPRTAA